MVAGRRAAPAGVMASCAFRDCGNPDCHLCRLARIPTRQPNDPRLREGIRDDARAVPQARPRLVKVSKKRHRVGPHR